MMYYGYGGGWLWMLLSMVVFWAVTITAAVLLVRYVTRPPCHAPAAHHTPAGPSAEQVLAERFARGDIDADEYRQRLQTLRNSTT